MKGCLGSILLFVLSWVIANTVVYTVLVFAMGEVPTGLTLTPTLIGAILLYRWFQRNRERHVSPTD